MATSQEITIKASVDDSGIEQALQRQIQLAKQLQGILGQMPMGAPGTPGAPGAPGAPGGAPEARGAADGSGM